MLDSVLHYRIIEKLGEGGMGVVYHARDKKLNRSVALKFLPRHITGSTERERFRHEARSAAALNHPNIAQVYAIEEADDEMFIVMEYVEGRELRDIIQKEQLTVEEKCDIAEQIASGIKSAHEKGIIHRDIKSRNIMVNPDGKVKIMDFGLAHLQDSDHITKTGTTLGTTAYMAPEILAGSSTDVRSDIWAFGVVLYELFAGELPFQGMYEAAVLYAITEEEVPPVTRSNPEVPSYIDRVIQHCLTKDKADRYQTMGEVWEALSGEHDLKTEMALTGKPASSNMISYLIRGGIPAVLIIILIGFLAEIEFPQRDNVVSQKRYLAVLPIENIGNDPAMQAICDGLAETFSYKLSELERYENSYWVAPASELRKEEVKSASQANKLFGVNLAITSSLQTLQDSTRVTLELVDADNLRRLETKQIVVPSNNLAMLERISVEAMMDMLEIEVTSNIENTLQKGGPIVSEAYEYYLKGRASLQGSISEVNLDNAIRSFHMAIKIDPTYALAYAGLGESYWSRYKFAQDVKDVKRAEEALTKAERLNDDLAPIQALLGTFRAGTGNREKAIKHYNRALEIDPYYTPAYRGLADLYEQEGNIQKVVATLQYAIALKPEIWEGYNELGAFYLSRGQFEQAAEQFQKVLEITPRNNMAYSNLGTSYYFQGKYDKAIDAFQMSLTFENDPSVASNLATIYYATGAYEKSLKLYEFAVEKLPSRYDLWANLAAVYDLTGKKEQSLESYRMAIQKGLEKLTVNPNDAETTADVGAYYSDIGDTANALRYIQKALSMNEENINVRSRAISTYEKVDMREEALKWVNTALISDIESQPELQKLAEDPRFLALKEKLIDNPEQ